MFTKSRLVFFWNVIAVFMMSSSAFASDEHGSNVFHAFTLEAAVGENRDNETAGEWNIDGWIGGDINKLWIKSEGEREDNKTQSSEHWILYSRNVDTFWDAQIGLRYDEKPESVTYGVIGFSGLAPHWFETEVHLFISDEGDVSARLHIENDVLLTQKLIFQPWVELNLFAQEVHELDTGSGLSDASIGLQLRYEITRKFAPYLEVSYEKLYGKTADMAVAAGENRSDSAVTAGFRVIF